MKKVLVVVALMLAFSGYAYAQWTYLDEKGGMTTIYKPDNSWWSYGTRPDGSSYTDFQFPGSAFIDRQDTGGPTWPQRRWRDR